MAFTYDLTTSRGAVRLALNDTVSGTGPRPDGTNFTDAELDYFLTTAGSDVDAAVARACQALALAWANVASITVGPRSEQYGNISAAYAARAAFIGSSTLTAGYVSLTFAEVADSNDFTA